METIKKVISMIFIPMELIDNKAVNAVAVSSMDE